MNFFKSIIASLFFVLFLSCSSESPFVSKEVVDELLANRNPFRHVGNIVAIIDNDVYYFDHIDSVPRRLTNSPHLTKTHIKLSSDRSKIAYLDESKSPVIISSTGEEIETIETSSPVKQLGWTNDDKSLYFLAGNNVYVYGEDIFIADPEFQSQYDKIVSFSMNNNGDQAYVIYKYMGFAGTTGNRLKYYSQHNNIDTLISRVNNEQLEFHYVDFTGDDGDFIIGYKDNQNNMHQIFCFTDHKFYTSYGWDSELMNTPVFNKDLEIVLFGKINQPSLMKALYLGTDLYFRNDSGEIKNQLISEFPSNTTIYLDWKQ